VSNPDAETEVAYELIAEPVQEPSAGEPQPGEVVDQAPEEVTKPVDRLKTGHSILTHRRVASDQKVVE